VRRLVLALAVAASAGLPPPTLQAQQVSLVPRLGIAAGLASYSGNGDVSGAGAIGRVLLSLESPRSAFSAEIEGVYHRFTVLFQRCPTCPFCGCSPEAPPPEVWAGRFGAQWHVRGAPGGLYWTAGLGVYSPIYAPRAPGRAALGLDLGLGARHSAAGLFFEVRCLRVQNSLATAWLVPVVVGYQF
jgi:hypothetical protein